MRKLPVRKLPARKILLAAIAGALLLPLKGFTLGLGEIEVNSALNQKLSADIELLSATVEDTENIIIKLASRKDFTRAGLDRPYLLNDLRFKTIVVDGTPHINVSSGDPIREPFLNFLLEIDWPNGHLLREYTVLLDPPVFMTQSASTTSATPTQTAVANDAAGFRPTAGATNIVPVVVPGSDLSPRPAATGHAANQYSAEVKNEFSTAAVAGTALNQPVGSYRIKSGDTAWSLADSMRPNQRISVEQMMIAMLHANPESFINENINGLKRGYILRTPDYDQITAISHADASALVREQAALWRQLQKTQSAGQPVSAMPASASIPSGGVAADAAADDGDGAYLEIVNAGSGSSVGSTKDPTMMTAEELRAELALARERVETERVEKEALQERVQSLESSVNTMKGMLSIEDDDLSAVQSLNEVAAEGDSGLTEEELIAKQELLKALEEESAEEMAADEPVKESTDDEMPAAESSTDEDTVFVDQTQEEDVVSDVTETEVLQPETAAPAAAPVVERPEPDPLSKLLNDPVLLAAAGGGLLLVIVLIALMIKRRKAASSDESDTVTTADDLDELENLADDVAAENDTAAEAETLSDGADESEKSADGDFDSDATMVLDSADDTVVLDAANAGEELKEEPRDDVIAEADVYLAYGIYQQAEELLTQAIADHPDRGDYRLKLAETHYASKNTEAFIEVAAEIRKHAGSDDVPEWKKVMVMGLDLCPDEEMFKGSMIGGVDVDSLAPKAPEMDFDLGINEVESEADPDLDLSLDDELELPEMDDADTAMDETAILEADADSEGEAAETKAGDEIEFDLNDTGAFEESSVVEDEFSLDIDASELDIDIQNETDESATEEESIEIDDIDIGLEEAESSDSATDEVHEIGDVDIDFGLDEPADEQVSADDEETAIDLSDEAESLDMDFDELDSEPETETETEVDDIETEADSDNTDVDSETSALSEDVSDAMDDDFDLSSLDDVDEISTKLDLARAYLDMGDHEGTRGILNEVIAEGSDEQKQEAQELLEQLD